MNNFPVERALTLIDDVLIKDLGFIRMDKPRRTKAQIFEVRPGAKQFALMVGDLDASSGKFKPQNTRVVLEAAAPEGLLDVEPLHEAGPLLGGHLVASRLKPDRQHLALVGSETGLRRLLEWYVSAKSTSTQVPSEPSKTSENQATPYPEPSPMMTATNTILYGPPGTGKTYSTTSRAVQICDDALPAGGNPETARARYEELRMAGRISFVTFHQSYGYEEFVEGLRPQASAAGQVSYSVVPGAFRRACDSARLWKMVKPGLSGKPLKERTIFKMSLGASWNDDGIKVFQYGLENQCVLLGWGKKVDFTGCDDEAAIRAKIQKEVPDIKRLESEVRFVNNFKHDIKVGDLIVVSHGNKAFRAIAEVTGDYEYVVDAPFHQIRPVKWLAVFEAGRPVTEVNIKEFSMQSLYKLNPNGIKYDGLQVLLARPQGEDSAKPHVLIIDEINRANISKVFGELITLLEPDKREGALNAITLKLPYSGEDFCVPANLHVLGTMNTADRSIALLDTALRRRFDFEELTPDPTVLRDHVEGIDLAKLLAALNERVEALYDRDHMIGHAFFIGVETLEGLEHVFRRKVLPLLQEYFYENLSNVRRVLNDLGDGDFVQRKTATPVPADGEDTYSDEPRIVYAVSRNAFPVSAYKRIYAT